jgi:hypothetical protein
MGKREGIELAIWKGKLTISIKLLRKFEVKSFKQEKTNARRF